VGLEHPSNPSLAVGYVELENGSLCASSGYKRKFGTSHHILDARKGESASHIWGTFIEAPCSLVAD
jgi:FAD:protein FMN transferase